MLSLALVLSTKAQSNQKLVKSKVGPDIVAYQKAGSSAQGQNQPKRKTQEKQKKNQKKAIAGTQPTKPKPTKNKNKPKPNQNQPLLEATAPHNSHFDQFDQF